MFLSSAQAVISTSFFLPSKGFEKPFAELFSKNFFLFKMMGYIMSSFLFIKLVKRGLNDYEGSYGIVWVWCSNFLSLWLSKIVKERMSVQFVFRVYEKQWVLPLLRWLETSAVSWLEPFSLGKPRRMKNNVEVEVRDRVGKAFQPSNSVKDLTIYVLFIRKLCVSRYIERERCF